MISVDQTTTNKQIKITPNLKKSRLPIQFTNVLFHLKYNCPAFIKFTKLENNAAKTDNPVKVKL